MSDDKHETKRARGRGHDQKRRDSGEPGGGQGRRDDVGSSGVYPMSAGAGAAPPDAELRTPAAWGQGKRGAEGYDDAGGSELTMHDGEILGGLTAGPSGEPTIDIHGGDRPREARMAEPRAAEPPAPETSRRAKARKSARSDKHDTGERGRKRRG